MSQKQTALLEALPHEQGQGVVDPAFQGIVDNYPAASSPWEQAPQDLYGHNSYDRSHGYEPLARELVRNIDQTAITDYDNFNLSILGNLRDQLHWAPDTDNPRLIRNGYAVARQIGDHYIAGKDREAFELIDTTRNAISFATRYTDVSSNAEEGKVLLGHHAEYHNGDYVQYEMGVSLETVRSGHETFGRAARKLEQRGVQINSEDLSLFIFLASSGHEAGHAIERGVLSMTNTALGHGHEVEQFAEGYGLLVVGEAARLLGYNKKSVNAIMYAVGIGKNSKDPSNYGYSHPYSPKGVMSTLRDYSQQIKQARGIETVRESRKARVAHAAGRIVRKVTQSNRKR